MYKLGLIVFLLFAALACSRSQRIDISPLEPTPVESVAPAQQAAVPTQQPTTPTQETVPPPTTSTARKIIPTNDGVRSMLMTDSFGELSSERNCVSGGRPRAAVVKKLRPGLSRG